MCQFTYISPPCMSFIFLLFRHSFHMQSNLTRKKFLCISRCSLWKLQGVWMVNIQHHLLFLARTDSGVAQMVSGASFGNCWCSGSDMNYASRKCFGLSSLPNTMSVAAAIGMPLKDMIPWSTSSSSVMFVKECTLKNKPFKVEVNS